MSYIGREYYLKDSQLKAAFERARKKKSAYLIHYGTSTYDFCCTSAESTDDAKQSKLDQAIQNLYKVKDTNFQSFYLIDVYDTSQAFNEAVHVEKTERAEKILSELRYQDALEGRPFWKKLFNVQP